MGLAARKSAFALDAAFPNSQKVASPVAKGGGGASLAIHGRPTVP
jgi:hypothetical protein